MQLAHKNNCTGSGWYIKAGLELRIWKGKAIFKKGTLDFGGHFGYKAKRHQGHQKKAQRPKKKGSKFKGGGGIPTHFILTSKKISPPKKKKKKKKKNSHLQTAQLRPRGSVCSFEGLLITFGFVWVSPGSGADPPKSECNKIKKPLEVEATDRVTEPLGLSSAQLITPLHSMQNALQCQWHALWSASAWNYVNKWQKIFKN